MGKKKRTEKKNRELVTSDSPSSFNSTPTLSSSSAPPHHHLHASASASASAPQQHHLDGSGSGFGSAPPPPHPGWGADPTLFTHFPCHDYPFQSPYIPHPPPHYPHHPQYPNPTFNNPTPPNPQFQHPNAYNHPAPPNPQFQYPNPFNNPIPPNPQFQHPNPTFNNPTPPNPEFVEDPNPFNTTIPTPRAGRHSRNRNQQHPQDPNTYTDTTPTPQNSKQGHHHQLLQNQNQHHHQDPNIYSTPTPQNGRPALKQALQNQHQHHHQYPNPFINPTPPIPQLQEDPNPFNTTTPTPQAGRRSDKQHYQNPKTYNKTIPTPQDCLSQEQKQERRPEQKRDQRQLASKAKEVHEDLLSKGENISVLEISQIALESLQADSLDLQGHEMFRMSPFTKEKKENESSTTTFLTMPKKDSAGKMGKKKKKNTPSSSSSTTKKERKQERQTLVTMVYNDLLSKGENISALKIFESLQMLDQYPFPKLTSIEGKVSSFIVCFVRIWKITSVYDLEVEICKSFGVKQFEDLQLGPLLRNPLVLGSFLVPSDGRTQVYKITNQQLFSYLVEFMDSCDENHISNDNFSSFVAKRESVPTEDTLCLRVREVSTYINFISEARKAEYSTLQNCLWKLKQSSNEQTEKREVTISQHRPLSLQKVLDEASSQHIRTKSLVQGFSGDPIVSSSSEDESDGWDVDNDDGKKYDNVVDNQGTGRNELDYLSLIDNTVEKFITTWKEECRLHSVTEVFDKMLDFYNVGEKQIRKMRLKFRSFPFFGILYVAVTSIKYGMWDSLYDTSQAIVEQGCIGSISTATELEMSKKSSLEVSMLQHQLLALLSQAASGLWENSNITKQHINVLLKKQFPLISFQLSGNDLLEDVPEFLNTHLNSDISRPVLFSISLLRTYYMRHSPVQDHSMETTALGSDFGLAAGALGSVSAKDALQCLLKAPMLSDLLSWSHWDLIFSPSLGPLLDWLLSEAHIENFLCLVTKDGKIIRVDHSATVGDFLEALLKGSSYQVAVKLLSLFPLYGGEMHVPLSLLKGHARRGIEVMLKKFQDHLHEESKAGIDLHGKDFRRQHMPNEKNTVDVPLSDPAVKNMHVDLCNNQYIMKKAVPVASRFILDILGYLPSEFCSFAADILLSGLQSFTKDAPIAILHECRKTNQRLMLHDIGFSLNILEWITDYHAFSSAAADDLFISSGDSSIKPSSPTSCMGSMFTPDTEKNPLIYDSRVSVTVEPDKHNEVSCGVDEVLNDVLSTGENDDRCLTRLPEDDSSVDASLFLENIRREEFGLDPSVTHAESSMLKKQHARLGRALQCLSQELYSQDSHFLLELVQNADDNLYSENVEPTLAFILYSTGIVVLNNERGFTGQNIRSLCDVGNSTKKGSRAGYIGQKGIGFKSVFRVTDAPEIHSNGFHVKFDIGEGQIGYVLPTPIPPCDIDSYKRLVPSEINQSGSCWNTCIVLPFKSKLREGAGMGTIISMFSDLHPSLLLFLHRVRCIKFKNMLNDSSIVMRRETAGNGIVRVSCGKENLSWFVATEKLQCSAIRPDVPSTEISVAFTLQESSNGEYEPLLDQQPVFAFLPLRTYGLRFILQGDFVLPSSREEVDGNSAWNQWLLSEFPGLFVREQRSFCALHCFQETSGKAVTAYMSFVPVVGEVHGFFSQLPRLIISLLRVSKCLLLEGHNKEWVAPCQVLRGWNEQVRVLLPDSLLHQHLGLGYLDKDIVLSDSLAKALGVHEYGPKILTDIISSMCRTDVGIRSMGLDWLLSWLNTLYTTLVHYSGKAPINDGIDADLQEILRKIPFVPLSDGTYSSVAEGTIWLPCDALSCGFEGEYDTEAFPSLYAKLRTVSPTFLSARALSPAYMEETPVYNAVRMLSRIGVQRLSAHELIKVHIVPAVSDDKVTNREKNLMAEYLSFVLLHLQSNCPRCHSEREHIMSDLKTKAFILTNHGYKRSAEVAIHFSKEFGNPTDMNKLVGAGSYKWYEVDNIYLEHSNSKPLFFGLTKWREFLQELGVTDFVRVIEVEKNIADLSQTIRKDMMCNGDNIDPHSVAKDWESPELVHLLKTLSSQNNVEKNKYLLEILDKMWDDCFSAKVTGICFYKSIEDGKEFKSSFLNSLHAFQWIASSIGQTLYYPKHLFHDCEKVRSLLGNFAPFAVPQVRSKKFVSDIAFKTQVTLDDAFEVLELWRSSKKPIVVSIDQMSKFYAFIWNETNSAKGKIAREFSSKPSIFVPFANFSRHEDIVHGKLLSTKEVYWHDPTGSVDLTREMLQCSPLDAASYPLSMILAHFYQGLHDFFVNDCEVRDTPTVRSYIKILRQLSKIALPSQAAKAVFRVLVKWANDLKSGLLEPEDVVYLKECLLKLETAVLPTVQDKWVSLHPTFGVVCWCNDEELKNQFAHYENIDFLYLGDLSLDEKEMLSTNISGLMQILGIPSLSEVITRQAIFSGFGKCRERSGLINWALPYAQRYIYKLHPENYIQFKLSGFEKLSHLQIVAVENLFYQLIIKGSIGAPKMQQKCSCLLQENILYVDQVSDSHSIFLELSRLFFNGSTQPHLANFLHVITIMAESGSAKEQIEVFIVNSQNVPKLPKKEPVWSLSALSSPDEESGNSLAALDEQNLSKSERKLGINPNWLADWKLAQDGAVDTATALVLQDFRPDEDQPLLVEPAGAVTALENLMTPINDRVQLSFGTPDAYQAALTGREGELVAFKYFVEKVGGASVKWVNEEAETGLPYDVVIGENKESMEYVEVKATKAAKKDWFSISSREWQFALEKGESFTIAHVILKGPNNSKVTLFKNPLRLCQQRALQLALVMAKS